MNKKMTIRATFSLASILSIRMLGLFMLLPVLSLYVEKLPNATPVKIGLALGIYGFTQALFQLPLGAWSDKIGRKPVIFFGLIIFALGSVIAAYSTTIYGIMLGRALQGTGAIGSTINAFIADIVPTEHRAKAMALLGMTIGCSFIIAIVLGPFLNTHLGLSGLFWITSLLCLIGMLILFTVPISKNIAHPHHNDTEPSFSLFMRLLRDKQLLPFNFGVCSLHAILVATFMAVPLIFQKLLGTDHPDWHIYLPVVIIAFTFAILMIWMSEKFKILHQLVFLNILSLILISLLFIFWKTSLIKIMLVLTLFFTVFSFLEAALPSLISKLAPASSRGTVMGIFSTFQFLGIFFGGFIGGQCLGHYGIDGIFIFCAILGLLWCLIYFTGHGFKKFNPV